jgi:hypothetical protein
MWHSCDSACSKYLCTSKARTFVPVKRVKDRVDIVAAPQLRQYLYYCTSKASKLNTCSIRLNYVAEHFRISAAVVTSTSVFVLLYFESEY